MFKNVPHPQNKIRQNKETRLQVKILRVPDLDFY